MTKIHILWAWESYEMTRAVTEHCKLAPNVTSTSACLHGIPNPDSRSVLQRRYTGGQQEGAASLARLLNTRLRQPEPVKWTPTCWLIPCCFCPYPVLVFGIYDHKVGYPRQGLWVYLKQNTGVVGSCPPLASAPFQTSFSSMLLQFLQDAPSCHPKPVAN